MKQPPSAQPAPSRLYFAAALAGTINGLLGAGGGSVLVPFLIRTCGFEAKTAMASSVFLIFPLSAVSVAVYTAQGNLCLRTALPYLIGGCCGGFLSGKLLHRCKAAWLRRGFGLLLLIGGVRMVLR